MSTKYWPISIRTGLVLALTAFTSLVYLSINALNVQPWRDARLLPLTAVDRWLGWHAWTIWPYWLLLILGPMLAIGIRTRWRLLVTLRTYLTLLSINSVIWLAWPTHIVRHAPPPDIDPLTSAAWHLLHRLDESTNCFPSGHVAVPIVIAVGFIGEHPRAWRWLVPLLLLLIPTVVTTGQHYAWDIVGGFATAIIAMLIAASAAGRPPCRRPLSGAAPTSSIQTFMEPQDR